MKWQRAVLGTGCLASAMIFGAGTGWTQCANLDGQDYVAAAHAQFTCSSDRPLTNPPADAREFRVVLDFPDAEPPSGDLPWKGINAATEPEAYIRALLAYGILGNSKPEIDWRIEDNHSNRWCHAPWFQAQRERLRGMTSERGSRPKELHSLQTSRWRNWAIGFYNDIGCHAVGRVWEDPAFPKTLDFAFAEGSYSIKLLFTEAPTREVPYLAGSKIWEAAIERDGSHVAMRLLQVDVAVKDADASPQTGWVFGTFMYDAYEPGDTVWERLVPVGLMWGNDPDLTASRYEERGVVPAEGWLNPAVAEKFYHLPRHNLGLHGRVNGPVDNPKSACLACHGRALDWGRAVLNTSVAGEDRRMRPFAPANPYDDEDVREFFRNLRSDQPFVSGTQSLDYSLQLSDGLMRFRSWVQQNYPNEAANTSDVPAYMFESERAGAAGEMSPVILELESMVMDGEVDSNTTGMGREETRTP